MGTHRPGRERLNMESVFSAARGARFQTLSICTLFSNDSSRVITVLFTNEVWKRLGRGEAVNSPAGMRRLSPREAGSIDPPSCGIPSVNGKYPRREAGLKSKSPSPPRGLAG